VLVDMSDDDAIGDFTRTFDKRQSRSVNWGLQEQYNNATR
jgi:hypothetical protein